MRRSRMAPLVAAVALVVGLVVGCSARGSAPELPPGGLDPLQPSLPAWGQGITPSPGTELARPSGTSMPWTLAGISDDRRTITVAFVAGDGDCVTHLGYAVDTQGSTLVLGEYSTSPSAGRACADRQGLGLETVRLPLALDGPVRLVHAPTTGGTGLPG